MAFRTTDLISPLKDSGGFRMNPQSEYLPARSERIDKSSTTSVIRSAYGMNADFIQQAYDRNDPESFSMLFRNAIVANKELRESLADLYLDTSYQTFEKSLLERVQAIMEAK